MHASARLGGHDTIPGALLESRVFRLSRMCEYLCPLSGYRRNKRLPAVCLKMHFCLPFTVLENDDKNLVNAKRKRKNTARMDSKKQLETGFRHPCCWNQTSILNVQSTRNLFSYVQRESFFFFFVTRNLELEVQSYHARSLHQFRLWWYVSFLHHATPSIY